MHLHAWQEEEIHRTTSQETDNTHPTRNAQRIERGVCVGSAADQCRRGHQRRSPGRRCAARAPPPSTAARRGRSHMNWRRWPGHCAASSRVCPRSWRHLRRLSARQWPTVRPRRRQVPATMRARHSASGGGQPQCGRSTLAATGRSECNDTRRPTTQRISSSAEKELDKSVKCAHNASHLEWNTEVLVKWSGRRYLYTELGQAFLNTQTSQQVQTKRRCLPATTVMD